jgi:hypothetical protein
MSTPEQQTLVQVTDQLRKAKAAFDAADQALTAACKAYDAAKKAVEPYISDFAARCSR